MFQGNGKIKILIDYIVSFLNLLDARWSGNYQHMQKIHNTRELIYNYNQ